MFAKSTKTYLPDHSSAGITTSDMSLQNQLKKNYVNYLLSIIVPAIISGVSIPVVKRMLGAEQYGIFSIYNNGVQILSIALTGWITQSILRFSQSDSHLSEIKHQSIRFAFISIALIALPLFFIYYLRSDDIILSTLLITSLTIVSFQLVFFSMTQSALLSRNIFISETLRTGLYIALAAVLVFLNKSNGIYSMIFSVIVAWAVSIFYLNKVLQKKITPRDTNTEQSAQKQLGKKFLTYGLPLCFWFVFANLLTYADKYMMAKYCGHIVQGNYQALFDLLYRGITMVASPVMMMLLPLLSKEYESGNVKAVFKILRKIILLLLCALALVALSYQFFAAKILLRLLNVPFEDRYVQSGFILVFATFVWLIGIVVNKKHELALQTIRMLVFLLIAFGVEVGFYLLFADQSNFLIYPFGYLLASCTYLLLVSLPLKWFTFNNQKNAVSQTAQF